MVRMIIPTVHPNSVLKLYSLTSLARTTVNSIFVFQSKDMKAIHLITGDIIAEANAEARNIGKAVDLVERWFRNGAPPGFELQFKSPEASIQLLLNNITSETLVPKSMVPF